MMVNNRLKQNKGEDIHILGGQRVETGGEQNTGEDDQNNKTQNKKKEKIQSNQKQNRKNGNEQT